MVWTAVARHFGWVWLIGLIGTGLSGMVWAQSPVRPAQVGMRFVHNYTVEEYKAADQNWVVIQDLRGVMYFANNNGVLEYDSATWRSILLPNRSPVRALAMDAQGRVFVGGANELGYLAPDEHGQQQFVSLLEFIPEFAHRFADVLRMYATPDGVFFQTSHFFFIWDGQRMTVLRPALAGDTFSDCQEINREIFLVEPSRGLVKLVHRTLQPVPGGQWLKEKRLSGLLPMPEGKRLAVVRGEGLLLYDGQSFTPFAPDLSKELALWDPLHTLVLPDGRFAMATRIHGVVILRPDGTLDEVIDKTAGLQSKLVHFLSLDRNGNLWMALDKGLARAELISPFTCFDERLGIEDVVQGFTEHAGRYYIATANRLYVLDPQISSPVDSPRLQSIPEPVTNCFGFGAAGNDLFVATENGVFQIEGTTATKVRGPNENAPAYCFCPSTRYPDRIYVGQRYGVSVLIRKGSTWTEVGKIPDIDTRVRFISELPDGSLWLGMNADGVIKVEMGSPPTLESFNPATAPLTIRRFTTSDGLPMMTRIRVVKMSGKILFFSPNGTFEFDEATQRFSPSTFLSEYSTDSIQFHLSPFLTNAVIHPVQDHLASFLRKPDGQSLQQLVVDRTGTLWGHFHNDVCFRLKPVSGGYQIDFESLKRVPAMGFTTMVADSHDTIWFGGTQGLIRVDPRQIKTPPPPISVLVRKILAGNTQELIFGGTTDTGAISTIELPYAANRLRIECALPVFIEEQATRYQYFLEGSDAGWSEWTTETVKEYTNLHEGRYRVRIRAEDAPGQPSLETACEFQILPPWYRTWWAYLGYLAGFAWAGMGIIRWRVQTLEDQKEALEQIVVERTQTVTQQNAELDAINRQLAENVEQLREAQLETERKNQELQLKNEELIASQQRADRIFSALAQALPGTVLDGKYRLDSKIGEGGFGAVFRGTHLGLNRPIAIKVFKPSHGNDSADAVERFRREGVSASRLNHPNAVRVLDFGISEQGIAYLVMELLQGHSLYHEMKLHRVLSPTRTADILVPICSALAEAHRLGIIHRDIKPENIFLNKTPEGEIVKVVDFGVAKLAKTESGGQLKQLTETGMVVGTPIYVAPERLTSDVFDGKSDVYSLGIMLFQMLTGTLPFNPFANNPMQVFLAALHIAPPAPNKINPKLSSEVSAVVLSALEKDPNHRPTARELARAFVKAVNQTDMPETSEWIAPNLTSEAERPQFVTDPGWNVQTLGGRTIDHEPTQITEPGSRTPE